MATTFANDSPITLEEPMYVKSSLAGPKSSRPPAYFDAMSWEHKPMNYEEAGCTYAPPFMRCSNSAYAPPMHAEWSYPSAEKIETGSDASTVAPEEAYYTDARNAEFMDNMAWPGLYPPMGSEMPFPSFDFDYSTSEGRYHQQSKKTGMNKIRQTQEPTSQTDLLTLGSVKHNLGQCKPCAFAWKAEGCQSGVECQFCHLCPPGEKQRRKKVLRQIQRSVGIYK